MNNLSINKLSINNLSINNLVLRRAQQGIGNDS